MPFGFKCNLFVFISSAAVPSEFELKLHHANIETDTMIKERKIIVPRRRPGQPPIRRINRDAQPLTPAEIMAHRHLLPPPLSTSR